MSDDDVPVTLRFPRGVYRALVTIATKHGVQVHHLLERVVTRSILGQMSAPQPVKPARAPRDEIDRRIVELNASGHGDNQIAKLLGRAQTNISKRRRDMGLASPTPKRGRKS